MAYYRIQVQKQDQTECGYQWRELEPAEFELIITGARPLGDASAQTLNSTDVDPTFDNAPVYYAAIWDPLLNSWIGSVDPLLVSAYYTSLAHARPGS